MLNKNGRPVVLVFLSHYLPAYKAGGQLRTVANMVEHLSDEFEFWIVTSDRDLGDAEPFPVIKLDSWQDVGKAKVYYISPDKRTINFFAKLISDTHHDILYLNSFFSFPFSIKPLLAVKYYGATRKPVILAPRGEFSLGALDLKKKKKRAYVMMSHLLGLYGSVCFQASSDYELQDIMRALDVPVARIKVAMDLPTWIEKDCIDDCFFGDAETLRVVFLSRISPMKNLLFALKVLSRVSRKLVFDIYGPKEDAAYWLECQDAIDNRMPEAITVRYCGSVEPKDVPSIFMQYDCFLFPTRGENYGHVIAESLSVGTPVLISDQTPWRDLESDGLGWDVSLSEEDAFVHKIESMEKLNREEARIERLKVRKRATTRLLHPKMLEDNKNMFYTMMHS